MKEAPETPGEAQLVSQRPPASCALHLPTQPTQPVATFVGPGYLLSFMQQGTQLKKKTYMAHGTLLDKENFPTGQGHCHLLHLLVPWS